MNYRRITGKALRFALLSPVFSAVMAQPAAAQTLAAPDVPSNLRVPPNNQAFLKAAAVGTQNYICMPSGWAFIGPQATLFVTVPWIHGPVRQQVATHALSVNPDEYPASRPFWQGSLDTSIVWARQMESSVDPAYVSAGAIPWLLLERAGAAAGPTGASMFSEATYIQRINTSGGLKPATACNPGDREFVPYTAQYVFYRKAGR